jgi:GntR family transcriptional regulator/MocR family aminotransferase
MLATSVTGTEFVAWFRKLKFAEAGRLVAEAAALGVGIYSVAPYYLKPPARLGLVFGFAALAERDIDPALARLGDAYRKVMRRR